MSVTSAAKSIGRAVGAKALKIRIPDAMDLATTLSMLRWKIRLHQSAHLCRAARYLRLPAVIEVGNFIVTKRSKKLWAPSEKAPLRHIPNNAILRAP